MNHLTASLTAAIANFIGASGYAGLALLLAIDACNIPLPSELTLGFAGYLVSTGRFSFWPTVVVGTLGFTLGAIISYWIGARGGRRFVERYGYWVLLTKHELDIADRWFARFGSAIAFFSRLLPIGRTFISLPAGVARMPFGRFVTYTVLGSFIWSVAFVYLGRVVGDRYLAVLERYRWIDYAIGGVIIVALVVWVVRFIVIRRADKRVERQAAPRS